MIKLIIFDLDGVLIDSRDVHFLTLNKALSNINEQYVIDLDEHLAKFDGLNTSKKLEILNKEKGLPKDLFETVWKEKQKETINIFRSLEENLELVNLFKRLKDLEYKIAVCSNSIRNTVKIVLLKLGIMEYVDCFLGSDDVTITKPFPEIYWQCMQKMKSTALETLILEDSHIGRLGAMNSGANLLPIESITEVNLDTILNYVKKINEPGEFKVPWKDNKLNVLIPMAGAGNRFAQQGYTFPKPLVDVNGKPMIEVVINNLNIEANYIFLVQKEHYEKYHLHYLLNLICPNCNIIQLDGVTEGAAITTLYAKEFINNDNPLLIANSDQYIEWNSNECMYAFSADKIDSGILIFESTHPKWSYVKLGKDGFVNEVAEKKVISNFATVGIYYWKNGSDYVKYAEQMISKNIRVNNEFYVCPVFNEAILDNKKIKIKKVDAMWGLGTPEDLEYFLKYSKKG